MASTGGVIWNSTFLMSLIDGAIVAAAALLTFALLRHRAEVKALGLLKPIILLLVGTGAIGLFHAADLLAMLILPSQLGHEAAMTFMTDLHLEWSWLVTLVAIGMFTAGLSELLGKLIPGLLRSMRQTDDARADLAAANERLERTVRDRTRALQQDVERRIETENALRESESRYRDLFQASPVALIEEDWSRVKQMLAPWLDGSESKGVIRSRLDDHPDLVHAARETIRVRDVNDRALSLFAAADKTALFALLESRADGTSRESFVERLAGFAAGQWSVITEAEAKRDDATSFIARVTAGIPATHREDWSRVLISPEDVTEFRELSSKLSYQATHDSLTGLVNRREFEVRLDRLLESARNSRGEHAVCYFDLDQFKVVNDTFGHTAGDEMLRQLAGLFSTLVRRRDTLARLGGDEFAVLIENCTMDGARRVAEGILTALQDYRFQWDGRTLRVGVSMGLVPIDDASGDTEAVMRAADSACYVAKDNGRNRLHVYRHSDVVMLEHQVQMGWAARLGDALEHDRFALFFQPIVPTVGEAHGGVHHELLLRLVEADGTLVAPGRFLPAAERYGISSRIDRWVIRAALGWYAMHPQVLASLDVCAINLSGPSLSDEQLLPFVLSALAEFDFPASRLCFEITETAAIGDLASACRFIDSLRAHGVRFALDDFGSGLSSFGYLKTLPVDYLKIDGLFVKDIIEDPVDREMVRAINEIAHVMGKQTIAEFVENDAIRAVLAEMGVDMVQGYGVGRPRALECLDVARAARA